VEDLENLWALSKDKHSKEQILPEIVVAIYKELKKISEALRGQELRQGLGLPKPDVQTSGSGGTQARGFEQPFKRGPGRPKNS
jgi:hypothetical protein